MTDSEQMAELLARNAAMLDSMSQLLASARQQLAHAQQLNRDLRTHTSMAQSPDQMVTVVVDGVGGLRHLSFDRDAFEHHTPGSLADAVAHAVRVATEQSSTAPTLLEEAEPVATPSALEWPVFAESGNAEPPNAAPRNVAPSNIAPSNIERPNIDPPAAEPVRAEPPVTESLRADPPGARSMGTGFMGAGSTGAESMGAESMGAKPPGIEPLGHGPLGHDSLGHDSLGDEPPGFNEPRGDRPLGFSEPLGDRPLGFSEPPVEPRDTGPEPILDPAPVPVPVLIQDPPPPAPDQIVDSGSQIDHVVTALSKLPSYTGIVTRVLGVRDPERAAAIAAEYHVGDTIIERTFLSTSANPAYTGDGLVRYTIDARHGGKPIGAISQDGEQFGEVVFGPGSTFRVTGKRYYPSIRGWDIALEELG